MEQEPVKEKNIIKPVKKWKFPKVKRLGTIVELTKLESGPFSDGVFNENLS